MAVLSLHGSSDDLIEVTLKPDADGQLTVVDRDGERSQLSEEFSVREGYNEFVVSVDGKEEFAIFARYGRGAAWGFGVAQADEDLPIPSGYKFKIVQSDESNYSVELRVTFSGKNVTVRCED